MILRTLSHDVALRPQYFVPNNETAAMLVFQANSVGVELFSYVKAIFCSNKICKDAGHVSENTLYRVLDESGKFGGHNKRKSCSNSSFLNALETFQVYP